MHLDTSTTSLDSTAPYPDLVDSTPARAASRPVERWSVVALALLILLTAVGRVWMIEHHPEPDTDAAGHLGIARALLADPLRVAVHWVYPPGYHYVLAALLALGFEAQGVRLVNCALAALLPILVWRYGARTTPASASGAARQAPILAAALCCALPIVNELGTSAQQETLFTVLVFSTVFSIDSGRFALGGVLLAIATTVRYDAWGAVGLLAGLRLVGCVPAIVGRLPAPLARLCRLPLAVLAPPLIAIFAWFVAHRIADHSWFGFLQELYRYTNVQRETFYLGWRAELLWFPVNMPVRIFGLALPLFFLGVRRASRLGWLVPFGIYAFLLASYVFKGALGTPRYYVSLAPFVCLGAAHGACVLGERWRAARPLAFAALLAHVVWLLIWTLA